MFSLKFPASFLKLTIDLKEAARAITALNSFLFEADSENKLPFGKISRKYSKIRKIKHKFNYALTHWAVLSPREVKTFSPTLNGSLAV